jgi:GAF domain-containing protein
MLGTYHLTALFEILNKIHFVYEPHQLWQYILEQTCKTVQAEASTFYEMSEDEKQLRVTASHGVPIEKLIELPFKVGVGICGWVAQFQQAALVNDVRQDNRFTRMIDMATGFQTRSVLCIPVFSQKRTYGVFEVINRKNGQFSPQDQEFMTLLARQSAVAYQNLLLIQEVSQTKTLMESLVANFSGGLIAIDAAKRITILNRAAVQLLALDGEAGAGKPVDSILKGYPWFIETLQQTLNSLSPVSRQETSLTVAGASRRIGYTTIVIADQNKKVLGSAILFQKLS